MTSELFYSIATQICEASFTCRYSTTSYEAILLWYCRRAAMARQQGHHRTHLLWGSCLCGAHARAPRCTGSRIDKHCGGLPVSWGYWSGTQTFWYFLQGLRRSKWLLQTQSTDWDTEWGGASCLVNVPGNRRVCVPLGPRMRVSWGWSRVLDIGGRPCTPAAAGHLPRCSRWIARRRCHRHGSCSCWAAPLWAPGFDNDQKSASSENHCQLFNIAILIWACGLHHLLNFIYLHAMNCSPG